MEVTSPAERHRLLAELNDTAIIVDTPVGIPSDHRVVRADPDASVLLLVRPDRASLVEAAEVLVGMDDDLLPRRWVVVVTINDGAGSVDRGSGAAAMALVDTVRCRPRAAVLLHARPRPGSTVRP